MSGFKARLKHGLNGFTDFGPWKILHRAGKKNSAALLMVMAISPTTVYSLPAPPLPTTTFDTSEVKALDLPDIPASVSSTDDKARFTLIHFWDKLNTSRQYGNVDRSFLESTFTGFVQLFAGVDDEVRREAINAMFDKAEQSKSAFDIIQDICFKYLYEPESPFYDEDYYIMVLERLMKSDIMSDIEKERPSYMLECALKNRPGQKATDFEFEMPDGTSSSLYDFKAPQIVMLFYDPDCLHCHKIINELRESGKLREAVTQGRVRVLAVYPYDDREGWEEFVTTMPEGWFNGINPETIDEEQLYVFPVLPALYLLDESKTVRLKDAKVKEVFEAI